MATACLHQPVAIGPLEEELAQMSRQLPRTVGLEHQRARPGDFGQSTARAADDRCPKVVGFEHR